MSWLCNLAVIPGDIDYGGHYQHASRDGTAMNDILRTLGSEFSDLANAAEAVRAIVRMTVSILLGGLLGYERESSGKSAGVRTHMLVALGACVFVVVPLQAGLQLADMSRVLQGLTSGIGFLCAGAILKPDNGTHIRGSPPPPASGSPLRSALAPGWDMQ